MPTFAPVLLAGIALAEASTTATARRIGTCGVGVDEKKAVPRCDQLIGTIALIEEQSAATPSDELSPGMRALVRLAEAQNADGGEHSDALPS